MGVLAYIQQMPPSILTADGSCFFLISPRSLVRLLVLENDSQPRYLGYRIEGAPGTGTLKSDVPFFLEKLGFVKPLGPLTAFQSPFLTTFHGLSVNPRVLGPHPQLSPPPSLPR